MSPLLPNGITNQVQRRIKKEAQATKTGLDLESEESSGDWIPMLSTNKKTSKIQVRGLNV
jgi:hypothetical protein